MSDAALYVGTFPRAYHTDTADAARGIHVLRGDPVAGDLRPAGVAPSLRPGWLALHPQGHRLYTANEVRAVDGVPGGRVTAYAVDARDPSAGLPRELGCTAVGASPCHLAVDATGRWLLVAGYHGAQVEVLALDADGDLAGRTGLVRHSGSSVDPVRQAEPHPHAVVLEPGNRFVLVPDLGTDRVEVHELDHDTGALVGRPSAGSATPPGSGPRHLVVHPDGALALVLNELSATISVFSLDADRGDLAPLGEVPALPGDYRGYRSGAEILLDATGRHVYVTHRSHGSSGPRPEGGRDLVAWFDLDPATGALQPGGVLDTGGAIARSAALDPTGTRLLVGHQGSGSVTIFAVDAGSGALTRVGAEVRTPVPVCLLFHPARVSEHDC